MSSFFFWIYHRSWSWSISSENKDCESQWPYNWVHPWAAVDPFKEEERTRVIASTTAWKTAKEKEYAAVIWCFQILWRAFFPSVWTSVLPGLFTTSKQFQPGSFCSSSKFASAETAWAEINFKPGENPWKETSRWRSIGADLIVEVGAYTVWNVMPTFNDSVPPGGSPNSEVK